MKRIISTIAVALAAVFAVSCGSSEQQASMKKIVFPGDYPDPSIMRDGKDFYMTHSSFTYYPGLLVWHSTNLVDWEPISRAVQDQPYSIYAPEICKVGDKFYIYYPTSSGQNFVVMADDPHGPWSEPVLINVRGIDPGHVLAENGKHYLYTNNGHMVELTDDGLATAGPNQKVYDGWDFPSDWETEGVWLESPKLVKHGDYWYLITAEGGTAGPPTSHMVVVARSTSALGPWENSPYNPMVHTYSADEEWWSKGHGTIFDDADGNWYIVYHSYRNGYHTLGRTSIIESVIWTEDGWPMLADPGLDFEEDVEGSVQFANLRDFHNPLMWAKWEPGFEGGELWTITAVDRAYEVCAEYECKEGAKAGLYLFYNEDAYVGVQAEDSHFFLRIVNDHNNVTTYKSLDGKEWNVVEEGVDVSEYHHNVYKGFFALRPSVLVGEGVTVKAFDYKVL